MALLAAASTAFAAGGGHRCHGPAVKNVIFMVPDGCDQTVVTAARWYQGGALELDEMVAGCVKNHMADSIITDSAAAATAFASGQKTSNGFVGVGPRTETLLTCYQPGDPELAFRPIATILEAAKRKGKSVGLVATCRFTHATPAAFASHCYTRGNESTDISEQMVYNNLDVLLAGGERNINAGYRPDGEDLEQVLIDRGYQVVKTKAEMDAVTGGKVFGVFAWSHPDAEIDRPLLHPDQPSLEEMTAKAIELLSRNPRGFFLMVEGSQVDWAGHNNDAIYMITDMIEFDQAVGVAKDFADSHPNTLVAAFPDHNTGGMKIGQYEQAMHYTETKIQDLVGPLAGMEVTSGVVANEINAAGGSTASNIVEKLDEWWGIAATSNDVAEIQAMEPQVGLNYAIARVITKNHTVIGWTTHGHNGEEVPLWLYGAGADTAAGTVDNTDLPAAVADMWNVDLADLSAQMFVNVGDEFDAADWTIDWSDPQNGVLVVKDAFRFPFNKDIVIRNGWVIPLGSVTVYSPTRDVANNVIEDRVYIPRWIIRMMKRAR
jgi:alkaline phosphatase